MDLLQDCEEVYGPADFALAGPGISTAFIFQVVCFFIFLTAQSFISTIISPHASSSTKIFIARLQQISDSVYTRGSLVFAVTLIAVYVRLYQGPGGFERNVMMDLLDGQTNMQQLAMLAYVVRQIPAKVKQPSNSWGSASLWLSYEACLTTVIYVRYRVAQLPSIEASTNACRRLAKSGEGGEYPHITEAPPGTLYLGTFTVLGLIGLSLLVTARYLPTVWSWIKRVCQTRIVKVAAATILTTMFVLMVGVSTWHLLFMRQVLAAKLGEADVQWDFGQIGVLVIWFPVVFQILLMLSIYSCKVAEYFIGRGGLTGIILEFIYHITYGMEPKLEEDAAEAEKCKDEIKSHESEDTSAKQEEGKMDEKLPLVETG